MEKQVLHVGIDVDDNLFHGYGISKITGEVFEFKCKPNTSELVKKLRVLQENGYILQVCYEAGYLGFSLYRELNAKKINCEVIAPSMIPKLPGKKVKTDKLDCRKLAEFYMKGILTTVHVPSEQEERVRDLVRSRKFLSDQTGKLKRHILALCRRQGLHYRQEKNKSSHHWTTIHRDWLKKKALEMKNDVLGLNITLLLNQLNQCESQIETYNREIEKIALEPIYKKKVQALSCYRGIDVHSAMVLSLEIGDIGRFPHPSKLTSFSGLDLREYSSGGKENKFGITKMGNRRIRTTVIEACQTPWYSPNISRRLKKKREGVDPMLVEIADRSMRRLHKKSVRLLYAGKQRNKVKVACARELLGFVWESLRAVA